VLDFRISESMKAGYKVKRSKKQNESSSKKDIPIVHPNHLRVRKSVQYWRQILSPGDVTASSFPESSETRLNHNAWDDSKWISSIFSGWAMGTEEQNISILSLFLARYVHKRTRRTRLISQSHHAATPIEHLCQYGPPSTWYALAQH
jgi:hypothetical protein